MLMRLGDERGLNVKICKKMPVCMPQLLWDGMYMLIVPVELAIFVVIRSW